MARVESKPGSSTMSVVRVECASCLGYWFIPLKEAAKIGQNHRCECGAVGCMLISGREGRTYPPWLVDWAVLMGEKIAYKPANLFA